MNQSNVKRKITPSAERRRLKKAMRDHLTIYHDDLSFELFTANPKSSSSLQSNRPSTDDSNAQENTQSHRLSKSNHDINTVPTVGIEKECIQSSAHSYVTDERFSNDNIEELQNIETGQKEIEIVPSFNTSQFDKPYTNLIFKENISSNDYLVSSLARLVKWKIPYEHILSEFKSMNSSTTIPVLPNSKEQLWKLLSRNESNFVRHYYCSRCSKPLDENIVSRDNNREKDTKSKRKKNPDEIKCTSESCVSLKPKISYFIQLKLYPQLQQLLSIPYISKSILYRTTRQKSNQNAIEDIFDGCEYHRLCSSGKFLSNPYNMSFTLNTDGCNVSGSSKSSAWPVYLEINELPPHARKRHMLLAGIYCDADKPVMNNLITRCLSELKDLYETGIKWKNGDGMVITSKFALLLCSVDSIARPPLLRMTQFNGEFGCTYCYAKGVTSETNQLARYYSSSEVIKNRKDKDLRNDMQKAFDENSKINGVKGKSCLISFPEFDLVKGPVVESMHSVYLGVTKQHIELLIKLVESKYLTLISQRLEVIRPPSRISRQPRSIADIANFKASEFRNWLLYYFLVCFDGLLEKKYLEHFALLSQAIYYLNQASITADDLNKAESLILLYVEQFEKLFGIEHMTFNLHLLKHLPSTIRNWGPMWAHNAFTFESWNRRIVENIKSPNARILQAITRFCLMKFISSMSHEEIVSLETKQYLDTLFPSFNLNNESKQFIGKGSTIENSYSCIPQEYKNANVTSYEEAKINNCTYRTIHKNPDTKFCNSYVYCKNIKYASIEGIVELETENEKISGLIVRKLKEKRSVLYTDYIKRVESTTAMIFVSSNEVVAPCIVIREADNYKFVVKIPNLWESD